MAGTWPQMFFTPCAAQASASSGMVDEGVIGNTAQTSLTRYAMWAAAVLPSMTTDFTDIGGSFLRADDEARGHALAGRSIRRLGGHLDGMTWTLLEAGGAAGTEIEI